MSVREFFPAVVVCLDHLFGEGMPPQRPTCPRGEQSAFALGLYNFDGLFATERFAIQSTVWHSDHILQKRESTRASFLYQLD